MDDFKEFQGKSLDEAIHAACSYFDASREKLEIDIIQDAKNGIFGLVGARKAIVKARRAQLKPRVGAILERDDAQPRAAAEESRPRTPRPAAPRPPKGNREPRPVLEEDDAIGNRIEAQTPDIDDAIGNRIEPDDPEIDDAIGNRIDAPRAPRRPRREEPRFNDNDGNEAFRPRRPRPDRRNAPQRQPRTERPGEPGPGEPRPEARTEARSSERPESRPTPRPELETPEPHDQTADFDQDEALNEGLPAKPFAELDQEQLTAAAQEVATKIVSSILGETPVEVKILENRVDIHVDCGDDSGLLIGREGQTLAALQYLTSRIVSRRMEAPVRIQFDVGDYRERQDDRLRELALSLAERVRTTGRPCSTRPMSSYHRRLVHMALQDSPDVQTRSSGEGPLKRVIIQRRRQEKH